MQEDHDRCRQRTRGTSHDILGSAAHEDGIVAPHAILQIGVGVTGLQLPCDIRFVWAGAKLAFPFVRRGIAPEGACRHPSLRAYVVSTDELERGADFVWWPAASSYLLPKLLGHSRALSLSLTGATVSPDSPLIAELYHSVLPTREEVFPAALKLAKELAENTSQTAVAVTKGLIWHGPDTIEETHILDSRAIRVLGAAGDAAEGARAFIERREPKMTDKLSDNLTPWMPWVSNLQFSPIFLYLTVSARSSGERLT